METLDPAQPTVEAVNEPPDATAKPPARPNPTARLILGGLVSFLATGGLSAILAAILLFAALSAISTILGGSQIGPGTSSASQPSSASDLHSAMQGLFAFVAYVFFASHFTPLEASGLGGATYSVIGIGSLSIVIVALTVPFFFARSLEKALPARSITTAIGRGLLIGLPYGACSLALYFPSFISVGSDQLGISLHPSGFALVLPALIAGLGGAFGAASVRFVSDPLAVAATRGASRAVVGVISGVLLTALIAGVWIVLESMTQTSNQGSASGTSSTANLSPAARDLGWSLLALVPFYIGNLLGIIWSAALGGDLFSASPWHPVIYLGPVAGALLGALQLRRRPDRTEQAAFAIAFAIGTAAIVFLTTPAIINGPSLVPSPWTAVVVALVIAAVAALAAPYLSALRPIEATASHPPVSWLAGSVLALWPRTTASAVGYEPTSKTAALPLPRFSPIHTATGIALVAVVVTGIIGNAQLSAKFSPEGAATEYLQAVSQGDVNAVWSMVSYEGGTTTASSLLSLDALKKTLSRSANTDLSNFRVSDSARQDDSNYMVSVTVTKGEQQTTMHLHLRRDTSRSNWLIYPFWRVVIPASVVQITSFKHGGAITVDGIDSGLSDTGGTIGVIPGQHAIDLAPTDIFEGGNQLADASNDTTVTFSPTLNAQATEAVHNAIAGLFTQCAAAQSISPANCPNSTFALGNHQTNVRWTLIGDPTSQMQLSIADAVDTIMASGQWKMHVSYDYWYDFDPGYVQRWAEDINGYFGDTLHWNGSGFDVTSQSPY